MKRSSLEEFAELKKSEKFLEQIDLKIIAERIDNEMCYLTEMMDNMEVQTSNEEEYKEEWNNVSLEEFNKLKKTALNAKKLAKSLQLVMQNFDKVVSGLDSLSESSHADELSEEFAEIYEIRQLDSGDEDWNGLQGIYICTYCGGPTGGYVMCPDDSLYSVHCLVLKSPEIIPMIDVKLLFCEDSSAMNKLLVK